jgi:multidrug resistance protein, MATE family
LPFPNPQSSLQAYGAKKYATVGVVLQRALAITTIFNLLMISMWGQAEWVLVATKQVGAWRSG